MMTCLSKTIPSPNGDGTLCHVPYKNANFESRNACTEIKVQLVELEEI